jgi:hypothetical protein
MKPLLDIAQILMSNPIGCVLLSVGLLIVGKFCLVLACDGLVLLHKGVARYFIRLNTWNASKAVFLALVFMFQGHRIGNFLQEFEQTSVNPVYRFETPEQADAVRTFELVIQKRVGSADFAVIQKYCRLAADTLGCDMLSIYAVALSECGLNPYAVHRKGCAAGWTQLTGAGCKGLILDGKAVTLASVKQACNGRYITYIMRTALAYWIDRANGRKVSGLKDFYMLIFAPAFIGCSPDAVLYEGKGNPNYYENAIFDGYTVDGSERIVRKSSRIDYRITAMEVELHVTRKMIDFLKRN